jgi:hypothetical protein
LSIPNTCKDFVKVKTCFHGRERFSGIYTGFWKFWLGQALDSSLTIPCMKKTHFLAVVCLIQGFGSPYLLADASKPVSTKHVESDPVEDHWVVPGERVGVIVLGMTEKEVTTKAGNHDGVYALPGGINVEYSEWKEPDKVSTLRMFYDQAGHVIQISAETWGVATKDGISTKSSLADVQAKYKHLEHSRVATTDSDIDYYMDEAKGITFAFKNAKAEKESAPHLYALIVHRPNTSIIPDINQRPVK